MINDFTACWPPVEALRIKGHKYQGKKFSIAKAPAMTVRDCRPDKITVIGLHKCHRWISFVSYSLPPS